MPNAFFRNVFTKQCFIKQVVNPAGRCTFVCAFKDGCWLCGRVDSGAVRKRSTVTAYELIYISKLRVVLLEIIKMPKQLNSYVSKSRTVAVAVART